jgi:hypothetical protein
LIARRICEYLRSHPGAARESISYPSRSGDPDPGSF